MQENTKYYSGVAPRRLRRDHDNGRYVGLPHVTIQMPVYKEGLHAVIEPTIRSVKGAISTYELQGGTANIFVNDDGMQLLNTTTARERQDFYDEHNIGWVARPEHNPKPAEGETKFIRAGKFKKASNMNYALGVSVDVETKMAALDRHDDWNQKDENLAYGTALREVIEDRSGEAWADGNIRVGDYILLIDSDTRVPQDCLLDAVSEMEQSPQVAIIQYASGVMNVTTSFFEKGITFFTNLVYTQIQYAVANGDVAPFVGHNAVVRWSAMQDIAYDCPHNNREKYWSENTVSEDFDMALRLQTQGYLIRLGCYKDKGFKEGVSLTVYDELSRWEKYAYGCNELIFHPLKYWLTRGPFTGLFMRFLLSSMPLPSKVTIMAYVGTYYALGSAWILTLLNYFMVGWFNGHLDHYYIDSFKVHFAIVVTFTALGNLSLAVLRYRMGDTPILTGLVDNLKWIPLLVIFLGGNSLHVSQAILSHFFGVDMQWQATAKEVENVTFFEEVPRVIKRFKWTFVWVAMCTGTMLACAYALPDMWRIRFFTPIWPLGTGIVCHALLPVVLNPNLMLFTW
jgi:glycosyltransferase involved in cell wall biosynthesis